MIDIHSHLLPAVDDGADSLATAVAMAAVYVEQQVGTVICTPHISISDLSSRQAADNRLVKIDAAYRLLSEMLAATGIPLNLQLGAEVTLSSGMLLQIRDAEIRDRLVLAGTSYMLVELPRPCDQATRLLEKSIYNLQLAGITPILAHPERISISADLLRRLAGWVRSGQLLLQVNASSVCKRPSQLGTLFDAPRQRTLRRLFKWQLVHFVASDAHNPDSRPPQNGQAWTCLESQFGQAVADRLLLENPARLLADQPIVS